MNGLHLKNFKNFEKIVARDMRCLIEYVVAKSRALTYALCFTRFESQRERARSILAPAKMVKMRERVSTPELELPVMRDIIDNWEIVEIWKFQNF